MGSDRYMEEQMMRPQWDAATIRRLREALAWYADGKNYGFHRETPNAHKSNFEVDLECSAIADDCGDRARVALAVVSP